jgi:hypothetical protein
MSTSRQTAVVLSSTESIGGDTVIVYLIHTYVQYLGWTSPLIASSLIIVSRHHTPHTSHSMTTHDSIDQLQGRKDTR